MRVEQPRHGQQPQQIVTRHHAGLSGRKDSKASKKVISHLRLQHGPGSVKNLGRYAANWNAFWPKRPSSTAALT